MTVVELHRLKELEAENAKLKRIVADQALDNAALKDLLNRSGELAGPRPRGARQSATTFARGTQAGLHHLPQQRARAAGQTR